MICENNEDEYSRQRTTHAEIYNGNLLEPAGSILWLEDMEHDVEVRLGLVSPE